jgi:hypothetical protein
MELGTVVDTKFGPAERPQLVVCVHVTPFELTKIVDDVVDGNPVSFRAPLDVWETFAASATPRQDKARAMAAPTHSGLKRLQSGARPAVTGVNAVDVAELKKALSDMKVALETLKDEVVAGNTKDASAIAALDQKLDALSNEVKQGPAVTAEDAERELESSASEEDNSAVVELLVSAAKKIREGKPGVYAGPEFTNKDAIVKLLKEVVDASKKSESDAVRQARRSQVNFVREAEAAAERAEREEAGL